MASATDILTDEEARVAIGLTATDTSQDALLGTYNAATSEWFDRVCIEPIVSRPVADCGAATSANVIPVTATDQQWSELRKTQTLYRHVSIGPDGDPSAVCYLRTLEEVNQEASTITIGGQPVTTTITDKVRLGWFADAASVDADLKIAAQDHLSWNWSTQRGQRGAFENFDIVPDVPWRIKTMIADRYAPGIV